MRAGDTTTPSWFPRKTAGGLIREDRIVLQSRRRGSDAIRAWNISTVGAF
jgi:hypothetical protein